MGLIGLSAGDPRMLDELMAVKNLRNHSGPLWAGVVGSLTASPAVLFFGIAFGAASASAGVSATSAIAMSMLVCAGTAQFSVLSLWSQNLLWPLVMVTFVTNTRYLVMSASMAPQLKGASSRSIALGSAFLFDANWAATRASGLSGKPALLHLVGGGLLIWAVWVAGTWLGLVAEVDPAMSARLGLDAIIPAFFGTLLLAMPARGMRFHPAIPAAAGSLIALRYLEPHWAILAGIPIGLIAVRQRND